MIFYGHILNIPREEVLVTRYGEMLDMITCYSIYKGMARPKKKKFTFAEAMELR